ncbi:hypothetical protein [Marivita sp. S2033]|uniref:hypothetical protein n=1 Tax=Marivita sp. S2033 TaxID=3373187 RepID=UPI003982BF89
MSKYRVRRRGMESAETYLDLMRLSFDEKSVAQKAQALPWLLSRHPKGHPSGSFFLTLEYKDKIVGGAIVLAETVWLDGVERPAFLPIGNHVHPDHRGRGLKMMKAMYDLSDTGVSMGIPNDKSFGVHRRFEASMSNLRTVRFRPYRAGTTLSRRRPRLSTFEPVLNAVSSAGLGLMDLTAPRLGRGERIERMDRFEADFDDFWRRARQNYAFLCVRSADRMNWRYHQAPFSDYVVDVLRRDEEIVGMVVSRVAERDGRKIGEISDILCLTPVSRDYALLLSVASRRLAKAGAEFGEFAFIGKHALNHAGRRSGFWFARRQRRVVANGFGPRDGEIVPRRINDLHFLRGDHDEDY